MEAAKFVPGVSGNPDGRPKSMFRKAFLKVLERAIQDDPSGRTFADAIAEKFVSEASKGKLDVLREIIDRVDGKATQAVEMSGPGGGPIDISMMTPEEKQRRLAILLAKAGGAKDGTGS